jgi:hypothetical protein
MTRDELISKMVTNRYKVEVITWEEFRAYIVNSDQSFKDNIVSIINSEDRASIGALLVNISNAIRMAKAQAYVDAIAADNTFTTTELLELL